MTAALCVLNGSARPGDQLCRPEKQGGPAQGRVRRQGPPGKPGQRGYTRQVPDLRDRRPRPDGRDAGRYYHGRLALLTGMHMASTLPSPTFAAHTSCAHVSSLCNRNHNYKPRVLTCHRCATMTVTVTVTVIAGVQASCASSPKEARTRAVKKNNSGECPYGILPTHPRVPRAHKGASYVRRGCM